MILLALALNLFSFVLLGLFGRFLGRWCALFFSLATSLLTFGISLFSFLDLFLQASWKVLDLGLWFQLGGLEVSFNILLDPLSASFAVLITFITTLIICYSCSYMAQDPHVVKFVCFLNFFAFSMLLLVLSGNYLQLFLGWEAVGLASFLLINFWHGRSLANAGALKAILFNRIGDVFFLAALAMIFLLFRSFDFGVVFASVPFLMDKNVEIFFIFNALELLAFFLVLAAMAKSAQLLLHPWLPDAMEGPTPVSALLHSATMVTAGIFLILRSSPIFSLAPKISLALAFVAFFTASFSSFTGLLQYDIKRIIAFSTCSQLGFITFAAALGNYPAALFHLFNHAFFKALLFLSAGSVIHATGHQDIRKMGGLLPFLPLTYTSFLLGSLSLIGFPFYSGFYGKDLILEASFSLFFASSFPIYLLSSLSTFLTSFYSLRLIYFVFFAYPNFERSKTTQIQESDIFLFLPMLLLSVLAIISGFLLQDLFVGPSGFWRNSLSSLPFRSGALDSEFIHLYYKLLPSYFALYGLLVVHYLYYEMSAEFYDFYEDCLFITSFLSKKFHFDSLYNHFLARSQANFSLRTSFQLLDKGLLEKWGPFGLYEMVQKFSGRLSFLESSFIYHSILLILLAFLLVPVFFLIPSSTLVAIILLAAIII